MKNFILAVLFIAGVIGISAAVSRITISQIVPASAPGSNGAVAYTTSGGLTQWLSLANPIGGPTFHTETPSGTINSINAAFTLANTPTGSPTPTFLVLTRNGLIQQIGASGDFTISGATITFNTASTPSTGDILQAFYF